MGKHRCGFCGKLYSEYADPTAVRVLGADPAQQLHNRYAIYGNFACSELCATALVQRSKVREQGIVSLPTADAERKAIPILTYLTEYFPDATLAEVGVAVAGNDQHNPGMPLHWAREKSKDQLNTAFRHLWDHKMGTPKDTDGQWHLAKAIWRLKAELQLAIEAERRIALAIPPSAGTA